jgi:hypothetical protein
VVLAPTWIHHAEAEKGAGLATGPYHISLKTPAEWLAMLGRHGLQPQRSFLTASGMLLLPVFHPDENQKLLFGHQGVASRPGLEYHSSSMGESLIVLAEKLQAS